MNHREERDMMKEQRAREKGKEREEAERRARDRDGERRGTVTGTAGRDIIARLEKVNKKRKKRGEGGQEAKKGTGRGEGKLTASVYSAESPKRKRSIILTFHLNSRSLGGTGANGKKR